MKAKLDELITIAELCDYLYIGKNKAYELVNSGDIKAFRVGKCWRIPISAVERYMDQ